MTRGTLRIYLGAAPGVGKTFAMLNEGARRAKRGTDVVIGYVETHGRPSTIEQLGGLEVVPRRVAAHRGAAFEEMDVDAVLARRPEVALVDELAHTNVPGSRNAKRWQDIDELLDAGIEVVSTVNVQHLESVNDVVEQITGIVQRETVPDHVVRSASQVQLIDMTPEALRRRMAHGNVYDATKVDAALANYFRAGNLAALRELALLWVADQVDSSLEEYRARHGITEPWETRERVVVALTGAPGGDDLVRRAARMARRSHGELLGVHVRRDEGLAGPSGALLEQHRRILDEVGGRYHEVAGGDVAAALVAFARAENATQLVLGASRRTRASEVASGSVINRVVRLSGPIDVHIVSSGAAPTAPAVSLRRQRDAALPPRRRAIAWAMAGAGLVLLTVAIAALDDAVSLPGVLLLYLLLVVGTAAVGGLVPALVSAVAGFLLANWYFTPPFHTFTIGAAANVLALAVYLGVAAIVSSLVAIAARRTAEANRSRAEAETLAALAGRLVDPDPLPAIAAELRRSFGLTGVALLRHDDDGWHTEASDGDAPAHPPAADDTEVLSDGLTLAVNGAPLAADDRRVLKAFGAHLAAALDRRRLAVEASRAASLGEANELRGALLQAVSHDLRTPLAGIKAAVSSLRQPDIRWAPAEVDEFLATVEDGADRLAALIDNLLDMSRIQAGALTTMEREVALDEVVPAAIRSLGVRATDVVVDVPEDLPSVRADPALLERVVANLVDNAVAHAGDHPVQVDACCADDRVVLRVVDRGPGIPRGQRDRAFEPFQRLDDRGRHGAGVGLGLAVARGFTRAFRGDLSIDDTPGGGTTMVLSLERAS